MPPGKVGRPSNAERERRRQLLEQQQQQQQQTPPPGAPPGPRFSSEPPEPPTLDAAAGLDASTAGVSADDAASRAASNRVPRETFKLDDAGEIDLGAQSAEKRTKLLRAAEKWNRANGGDAGSSSGSSSTKDAGSDDGGFTPDQVSEFLTGLGWIQTLVATKVWGVPLNVAREIVPYNDHEKKLLAKPAARVLNKRTPAILKKYADEITLITILGTVTGNKISELQAWVEKNVVPAPGQGQQQQRKAPTPPPANAQPSTAMQPATATPRTDGTAQPATVERPTQH